MRTASEPARGCETSSPTEARAPSLREVHRYATGERSTNPTISGGLLEHVYGPNAREDLELAR